MLPFINNILCQCVSIGFLIACKFHVWLLCSLCLVYVLALFQSCLLLVHFGFVLTSPEKGKRTMRTASINIVYFSSSSLYNIIYYLHNVKKYYFILHRKKKQTNTFHAFHIKCSTNIFFIISIQQILVGFSLFIFLLHLCFGFCLDFFC